jgi:hypothetical protein
MTAVWHLYKNVGVPLHEGLPPADQLPWTISYVARKRAQLDSFAELPREKRPPDRIFWHGTPEELDDWFDKVLGTKEKTPEEFVFVINEDDVG